MYTLGLCKVLYTLSLCIPWAYSLYTLGLCIPWAYLYPGPMYTLAYVYPGPMYTLVPCIPWAYVYPWPMYTLGLCLLWACPVSTHGPVYPGYTLGLSVYPMPVCLPWTCLPWACRHACPVSLPEATWADEATRWKCADVERTSGISLRVRVTA